MLLLFLNDAGWPLFWCNSRIHTIDLTSNQQISKMPLNYLIDQLENPSSIWARWGNRADSLWVKQGGVVGHMSMLSLCKRSSIIRGLQCFFASPHQSFTSIQISPGLYHLVLWGKSADTELISCCFTTNPLCKSFFFETFDILYYNLCYFMDTVLLSP